MSEAGSGEGGAGGGEAIAAKLLGEMSFKLRTPVNAIMGYCEMLMEDVRDLGCGGAMDDLKNIHLASKQLLAMVNHIVVSSSYRDGRIVLRLESMFGANLRHELRTPVNAIIGYSELLSDEAGGGELDAFREDLGRIRSAGKNLLKQIDYFFSSPGAEGGGVRVDLDSSLAAPGRLDEVAGAGGAGGAAPENAGGSILLVEDNEMNRDMLRRRLERIGHSVAIAETGAQALAFLRGGKPDLILLDIVLPDASGVDIVRTLRKDLSRSELPVIMVTAKDQREDVIGALDAGANDYLTKPIDFPVALARIRCNLALARLGAQLRQRTLEAERLARQVGLLTGGL